MAVVMGKKNIVREKICDMQPFDPSQYGFIFSTHEKYMGAALAFLEAKAPSVFSFFTGDRSREFQKGVLKSFHPKLKKLLESEAEFAASKTSDSWRQLRLSLMHLYTWFGLEKCAEELHKIKNPSSESERAKKPKAKKRMKKIPVDDFVRICDDRLSAGDFDAWSILLILAALGCRPCDIPSIKIKNEDRDGDKVTFYIGGSKNTERGSREAKYRRGLEREETLPYDDMLISAVLHWSGVARGDDFDRRVNSARGRVARAVRRLKIPGGKRFCFYTLRYQKGSYLKYKYKDDDDGARKIAVVMGHKCTRSASSYGDTNAGKGLASLGYDVEPDQAALDRVIDNRSDYIKNKERERKGAAKSADVDATVVVPGSEEQHDSTQQVVDGEQSSQPPSEAAPHKDDTSGGHEP